MQEIVKRLGNQNKQLLDDIHYLKRENEKFNNIIRLILQLLLRHAWWQVQRSSEFAQSGHIVFYANIKPDLEGVPGLVIKIIQGDL